MSARFLRTLFMAALIVPGFAGVAAGQPDPAWIYEAPKAPVEVDRGPRRTAVNIGTLSMITPSSRSAVLARIDGNRVYDLSVQTSSGCQAGTATTMTFRRSLHAPC